MIEHVTANWELYIAAVGAFLGLAMAITKLTTTKKDDEIVGRVKDTFDSLTKKSE